MHILLHNKSSATPQTFSIREHWSTTWAGYYLSPGERLVIVGENEHEKLVAKDYASGPGPEFFNFCRKEFDPVIWHMTAIREPSLTCALNAVKDAAKDGWTPVGNIFILGDLWIQYMKKLV